MRYIVTTSRPGQDKPRHKMIFGIFPFEGETRKEIFEKIKKGDFEFGVEF